MINKLLPYLLLVLIAAGCGQTSVEPSITAALPVNTLVPTPDSDSLYPGPGDYLGEVEADPYIRIFHLHVPPSYEAGTPMPLVLSYHGAGATFTHQEQISGLTGKADDEGFIVVYMQALPPNQFWLFAPGTDGNDDYLYTENLLAQLQEELSIDPKRIYATGFSNGAGMTDQLACNMSDTFAAIGTVAGAYTGWRGCDLERPVPVIAFHGTADTVIAYDGRYPIPEWAGVWASRNGCDETPTQFTQGNTTVDTWEGCEANATVSLYSIAGGGHTWEPYLLDSLETNTADVIWDFFLAHPMP